MRILLIHQYLRDNSDENHVVSLKELKGFLADEGLNADRKTITSDIESLREFGYDIESVKGAKGGYYAAEREMELSEIKLLVDAIQSSRFITKKKTQMLIRKLESMCSIYQASELNRDVFVSGRVKSMNESIFYVVDSISNAISENRAIEFQYYEYDIHKNRVKKHDGAFYQISPWSLIWDNENYYLLGFDEASGIMKHFRVDKISSVKITEKARAGKEEFESVDISTYADTTFGMYHGERKAVKLRFENKLVGAVIDRFGTGAVIIPDGDSHFTVTENVAVSPQFFAWVYGLGAEILSPEDTREEMIGRLREMKEKYGV